MPGPHVQVAAFCEKVLREKDDVVTLVRVIDRITHTTTGPDAPSEMPSVRLDLQLAIILKSGDARGRNTVVIRPEAPSGQHLQEQELPVHFEGANRGVSLVLNMSLEVDMEGVWWFDLLLGEQRGPLTRVPLEIVYRPLRTGT